MAHTCDPAVHGLSCPSWIRIVLESLASGSPFGFTVPGGFALCVVLATGLVTFMDILYSLIYDAFIYLLVRGFPDRSPAQTHPG